MKLDKRLLVTIVVFLIYMLTNFHRPAVTVMGAQLMKDFAMSAVSFGFIGAIFMWVYALMQFPVGTLNDTWGPRKVLLLFLGITTVGAALFGFAQTYAVLVIARVLVAAGIAAFAGAGAKLLAEWYDSKQFGKMWGSFMAWGLLGGMFATTPLIALMTSVGWRISFEIIGLISLVILILAYFIIQSPKQSKDEARQMTTTAAVITEEAAAPVKISAGEAFKSAVSRADTWLVVLFFIGVNSSGQVLAALWGGVFLSSIYGYSKSLVGNILMVSTIFMIVGSLFSGFVKPKVSLITGSFIFTIVWLVLTICMNSLSLPMVYIIFALIGFLQIWSVVGGFIFLRSITPAKLYGTVYGVANGAAWILGAGLFQQIWGYILQNAASKMSGFHTALQVQLIVLALSCIAAVILYYRSSRQGQAA